MNALRPFGRRAITAWIAAALLSATGLPLHAQPQAAPPARTAALPSTTATGTTSPAGERFSHGRFQDVRVLRPAGEVKQFVLLLSDTTGWDATMDALAKPLVARGALVAGIDTPKLIDALEADGGRCTFPDGDLENLAHSLQAYARVPTYLTPILAGAGIGASLGYAVLAQTKPTTFAGGIATGFCPELPLEKPLCKGEGQHFVRTTGGLLLRPAASLPVPWWVVPDATPAPASCTEATAHAFVSRVAQAHWLPNDFASAYASLDTPRNVTLPPPPSELGDLPLIEEKADGSDNRLVILLSGDGGWAGIDKELAEAFVERGIAVVGFDSLRYFWTARTPDGLATDLDRVMRYYAHHWKRDDVVLVGYSQGADVLPFAINRLPAATRSLLHATVLMAPGQKAAFEFRIGNWLGSSGDRPIAPEAQRLDGARTLCVYGQEEKASLCPDLTVTNAQPLRMPGGHHFGGDYERLASLIVERLPK